MVAALHMAQHQLCQAFDGFQWTVSSWDLCTQSCRAAGTCLGAQRHPLSQKGGYEVFWQKMQCMITDDLNLVLLTNWTHSTLSVTILSWFRVTMRSPETQNSLTESAGVFYVPFSFIHRFQPRQQEKALCDQVSVILLCSSRFIWKSQPENTSVFNSFSFSNFPRCSTSLTCPPCSSLPTAPRSGGSLLWAHGKCAEFIAAGKTVKGQNAVALWFKTSPTPPAPPCLASCSFLGQGKELGTSFIHTEALGYCKHIK